MEQSILNVIENILTKGKTQIVSRLFVSPGSSNNIQYS